jgi:hypothetical protein
LIQLCQLDMLLRQRKKLDQSHSLVLQRKSWRRKLTSLFRQPSLTKLYLMNQAIHIQIESILPTFHPRGQFLTSLVEKAIPRFKMSYLCVKFHTQLKNIYTNQSHTRVRNFSNLGTKLYARVTIFRNRSLETNLFQPSC